VLTVGDVRSRIEIDRNDKSQTCCRTSADVIAARAVVRSPLLLARSADLAAWIPRRPWLLT